MPIATTRQALPNNVYLVRTGYRNLLAQIVPILFGLPNDVESVRFRVRAMHTMTGLAMALAMP